MKRRIAVMVLAGVCGVGSALLLGGCATTDAMGAGNEGAAVPAGEQRVLMADLKGKELQRQRVEADRVAETPPPTVHGGCVVTSRDGDNVVARMALPTHNTSTSNILVERMVPAQLRVGQPFDCVIKVTNLRNCALEKVVVTDELPAGFAFESSEPAARPAADGKITWALGRLEPGESRNIVVRGTPTNTGQIEYCCEVTYVPLLCIAADVIEPKLKLTKTAPAEVVLCEQIPVKLVVSNPGTGSATNVTVSDQLPESWTTAEGQTSLNFAVGTLKSGESKEFTFIAQAGETGVFENRAFAKADGGLTAEASTQTRVRQAVLTINKKGTTNVYLGRPIAYEIAVKNEGDVAATDVVVEDILPAGAGFVSASDGGVLSGNKVVWRVGTLEPEATKTVTVDLTADSIGTIVNRTAAVAYCAAPVAAELRTVVAGIPAILLEVIDLEDPIEVGGIESYIIKVTNQGSALDTNIRITSKLEESQEFVSAAGPTDATHENRVIRFAPLPSLAPKAVATWEVKIRALKAGDVRFATELTSDQLTRVVQETESTNQY